MYFLGLFFVDNSLKFQKKQFILEAPISANRCPFSVLGHHPFPIFMLVD